MYFFLVKIDQSNQFKFEPFINQKFNNLFKYLIGIAAPFRTGVHNKTLIFAFDRSVIKRHSF